MFKERKDNFSFDLLLSISKETNILFEYLFFIIKIIKRKLFLFLLFLFNIHVFTIC